MQSTLLRAGAFALFAVGVTACGPGVSSLPYQQPSNASITTSTSTTVTLPSLTTGSIAVTGSIGPTNVAASITELLSLSAPSDITVPLAKVRTASHVQDTPVGTANLLLYVTFSSSTAVTMTASPTLTFTSSSIDAGTMYNLALYSGGAWTAPFQSSVTPTTAGSVTFPSTATPVAIAPGAPATFVLYTGTATSTPIVLLPTSLTFDAGNPTSGSFGASETGYAGALSATMTCTENPTGQTPGSNAFVAEFTGGGTTASETPASAGASVTFSVSSGAETGACSVVVSDTNGNTATETIDVSSTNVTVTGKQRN